MTNREQELNQALEAMHFGFRAMIYKPDQRLAELRLSRIHHRLLYFINRNPGCSVNRLAVSACADRRKGQALQPL